MRPHEVQACSPCSPMIKNMTSPKAKKWDFDTTIAKTMEWYKLVNEGASPIEVTQRQISEFSQL